MNAKVRNQQFCEISFNEARKYKAKKIFHFVLLKRLIILINLWYKAPSAVTKYEELWRVLWTIMYTWQVNCIQFVQLLWAVYRYLVNRRRVLSSHLSVMRRSSMRSLVLIMTRFAWMVKLYASSKNPTMYLSAAYCSSIMPDGIWRKSAAYFYQVSSTNPKRKLY